MARAIPQVAFDIAKDKERLVLFVYDDAHYPPKEACEGDTIHGTLTAGYGHTGSDVKIGMRVSQLQADGWLYDDLSDAANKLEKKVGADIVALLTNNQYSALLSFVLNLGTGRKDKPEWTIWKRLRERAFDQVPVEMARFVNREITHPDGTKEMVKENGLVDRRNAEIGLWAVAEPGTVDTRVSSSVTRNTSTPPTPTTPGRSKALITGAIGAVAGAGPMLDKVSHTIAPYAQHSHYVESALGILAGFSAICASVGLYYVWRQARNARN